MIVSEKKVAVVCIIFAVIGIMALFIIASVSEPMQLSASEAAVMRQNNGNNNQKVKIRGFVDSVDFNEGYAVVKIAELKMVDAVSFDSGYVRKLGLRRLQEVEITGEIRNYKGTNSVIVDKIKPLGSSCGCNGYGTGQGSLLGG